MLQDVHEAIQDSISLLRVPRSCLNICCSSRGAVSGLLSIQETEDGPWSDCRASGYKTLPGDCNAILDYCFQTTAQYILVVEKDVSTSQQYTLCLCPAFIFALSRAGQLRTGLLRGRAVEGRAVEGRPIEGRAVKGRAVEGRYVQGRFVEGRTAGAGFDARGCSDNARIAGH